MDFLNVEALGPKAFKFPKDLGPWATFLARTGLAKKPQAALEACCDAELNVTSGTCKQGDYWSDWTYWTGADCVNGGDALADWDTSLITDMNNTFYSAHRFNGDLSGWNVSSVTSTKGMFQDARGFNRDLNDWDVSSVTSMAAMFAFAHNFNGDVSDWDVSSVTTMEGMFFFAYRFNGDASDWDVSSVTNMGHIFYSAYRFNGDISDWDVSSVESMKFMFYDAHDFNCDLSDWDVSSVTDMKWMFTWAIRFDSDISDWDVSSVTGMYALFYCAYSFDGDLSDWDVSSVEDMGWMFYKAMAFTGRGGLSDWDVSSVTTFKEFMRAAKAFDGNVSGWNMARSLDDADDDMFYYMFMDAYNFKGIGLEDWTFNSSWDQTDFDNMGLYHMFVDWTGGIIGDVTNWPHASSFDNVDEGTSDLYLFSPSSYNCSDEDDVTTCTMNGCSAGEMTRWDIPNGALGDCGDADLDHKDVCTPTCDAGYEASGHMVCYGSFAINSFECKPILTTCTGADDAPDHGSAGNCTASLADREKCTPACNSGYTGHGGRICSLGSVIDFFECVQDAERCDIETPSGGSPTGGSPTGGSPTGGSPTGGSPTDDAVNNGTDGGDGTDSLREGTEESGVSLSVSMTPAVLGWVALTAVVSATF